MRKALFIYLILLSSICISAQKQVVDSLVNVLETEKLPPGEQLKAYNTISFFYARNDLQKGQEYATKGLQLARKEKDKGMESTFNRHLGIVHYYQSDFDTSRIYLDRALELAIEAKDKAIEMATYSDLGNLYFLQGILEPALNNYMKGLALSSDNPDRTTAVILNNIGNIQRTLQAYDRALDYYGQALEIAKQLNLEDVRMGASLGLGGTYADMGETDKAIEYLTVSLEISRKLGNIPYEVTNMVTLGAQYAKKEEFDKAVDYCINARQIAEKINSPRDILNAMSVLSNIYLEMKKYRESVEVGMEAWEMDSVTIETGAKTAITLSVGYIYLGEKERAEQFIRKYHQMMTEGSGKSLHDSLADMEVRYETEKKEMRIAALEKEKQLYSWLGIVGLLLAFTLAFLLWFKIKNAQKEKQLIATRSVLDGEMKERARLGRDLHDRLSGNLSALKIGLSNMTESVPNIQYKLDGCIEEIRRVAHNLMPISLQHGLKITLEDFAAKFPNVHFHFFGKEKRLEDRTEFVLFCCASELVSNALRHSGAESINIQLIQSDKYVSLTVQDNGSGFDEKTVKKGIGLKSMYDRVTSCNGKVDIVTSPGKGCEITIEIKTGNR